MVQRVSLERGSTHLPQYFIITIIIIKVLLGVEQVMFTTFIQLVIVHLGNLVKSQWDTSRISLPLETSIPSFKLINLLYY